MKYSDDCKVYRIRYYNVWFYLFAKTEMDEYKINILGERIGMGDSMMMKDIHCWCTRQNIRYRTKFKYRKDYPILANIWNRTRIVALGVILKGKSGQPCG